MFVHRAELFKAGQDKILGYRQGASGQEFGCVLRLSGLFQPTQALHLVLKLTTPVQEGLLIRGGP